MFRRRAVLPVATAAVDIGPDFASINLPAFFNSFRVGLSTAGISSRRIPVEPEAMEANFRRTPGLTVRQAHGSEQRLRTRYASRTTQFTPARMFPLPSKNFLATDHADSVFIKKAVVHEVVWCDVCGTSFVLSLGVPVDQAREGTVSL
jgi:hypothetical protein